MLRYILSFSILVLGSFNANADQVRYLAEPDQAFSAFQHLLTRAQRSINLATFIFEPCHASTQLLLEELARKAQTGVRVRVILDSLQQNAAQEQILADYFAKHGMEVRFYNSHELNLRLHIKMLTVDDAHYITGGRNISDEYFGLSHENNYVDRDVMVSGASAKQAAWQFDELWTSSMTHRRAGRADGFLSWLPLCGQKQMHAKMALKQYMQQKASYLYATIPERSCSQVHFTADSPDFAHAKYNGEPNGIDPYLNPMRMARKRATKSFLSFLGAARSSLEMENWVYMPIWYLSDAFAEARERRVRIRVLTNQDIEDGPQFFREAMDYAISVYARRDGVAPQSVALISSKGGLKDLRQDLTPAGVPVHLHSKIVVRDGRDVVVGSFNLDSRSYGINLESMVTVRNCAALAEDVRDGFLRLERIHADDLRLKRVPSKKEPSFMAKLFATLSLVLL